MPKKKVMASLADPVLISAVRGYVRAAKKESDGKTAKGSFRTAIIEALPSEGLFLVDKFRVSLAITEGGTSPDTEAGIGWLRENHPRIYRAMMAVAEENPKTTKGRTTLNVHPA